MTPAEFADNALPWMAQGIVLATVGSLLPVVFRIRHPSTQLLYCHLLLAACLAMPFLQRWQHPMISSVRTGADSAIGATAAVQPGSAPARANRAGLPAAAPPAAPPAAPSIWTRLRDRHLVWWISLAGAAVRLGWLLAGLWQIRRYRIAATPLYPIPESVEAASSLTHADALVCISPRAPGPVMLGWLRPVVLLPEAFLALGDEAQCGVVCHELLHVRRRDWLVTLLEEVAGALLWFNPGIWLLLAQTRLAREQLVDAEAVRLTAAREPYLDALLAIARAGAVLDLAPAPLFLRRRHLTQRMHSLLREVSMSRVRLLSSYASIAAVLAFAGLFAAASFPLVGSPRDAAWRPPAAAPVEPVPVPQVRATPPALQPPTLVAQAAKPLPRAGSQADLPVAPVPFDAHEPVTGGVQIPSTPADRAAALSLLERALQNSDMHMVGTPPFRLDVSFTAGGNAAVTGSGEVIETWLSGRSWRWSSRLGGYSHTQYGSRGMTVGDPAADVTPMRVHMLRNAIFWPVRSNPGAGIRTAAVKWNGKPATCILFSGMSGPRAAEQVRLWEEIEYCVDNSSGLLQVASIAPGSYDVYSYTGNLQFHGRSVPDRVTIYIAGAAVLDAQVSITDAGSVDESQLQPSLEMIARGPAVILGMPERFPMNVAAAPGASAIQPAIVHAEIDSQGNVREAELLSAADPRLGESALDLVKQSKFQGQGTQRQAYINVRYVPASQ